MEAFRIRPAEPADAADLAETVRQGFEGYRRWAPDGWEPPPPQLHLVGIRERLGEPGTWCALACADGVVAGHAAITPARERHLPFSPLPGLAHLWMLFVREPWWGSGLAADLLARAVGEAGRRGFGAIRLYTPTEHSRARTFYEREGWRREGKAEYEPGLGLMLVEYRRGLPRSMPPCHASESPTPGR